MKENGILIEKVDVHPIIRKAAETNKEWEFAQEAEKIYRHADEMMARFYNGVFTPQFPNRIPAPIIAIEDQNIRTFAAYRVVLDGYGLPYKLTFNQKHFIEKDGKLAWRWGDWSLFETLCHELGHHWQKVKGPDPLKPGKVDHGVAFTEKMHELGLRTLIGHGSHYAVADADSPFGTLMREWGIARPDDLERLEVPPKGNWFTAKGKEKIKGQSSLTKWYCSVCCFAIRVGVKGDIQVTHDPDGGKFIRA